MTIYIGADHKGFFLKQPLIEYLQQLGYTVIDCGANELNEQDDYVDFAQNVALSVSQNPHDKGILLCGSGVGMAIAANKISGVRASIGMTEQQVKEGRTDDDMNILVLAASFLTEADVMALSKVFLETPFAQEERFIRRLNKIKELETQHD